MYSTKLPKRLRSDFKVIEPKLGVDVPAKFYYDLKAMDPNLYLVYHPIRVLPTSPVINQYSSTLEEYRTPTSTSLGFACWGYPLTDRRGAPIPEGKWHVYRLCDQGWAHVITLDYRTPEYLHRVVENIYMQVQLEKRGRKAYREYLEQTAEEARLSKFNNQLQEFNDIQNENKWLLRRAREEASRGNFKPTRVEKETISSYAGQKNRSRIIRPATDTEGGLILPDRFKN